MRIRRGHELRLILASDDAPAAPIKRDEKLVMLIAEAQQAKALVLASPGKPIQRIAAEAGRCRKRLPKLVRLSWLAPDIVRAILSGRFAPSVTTTELLEMELPFDWRQQRVMLGLI
jgi:site-specific DNA recombinase